MDHIAREHRLVDVRRMRESLMQPYGQLPQNIVRLEIDRTSTFRTYGRPTQR